MTETNFVDPRHPHEMWDTPIPAVLTDDGRCIVCGLLVERDELYGALREQQHQLIAAMRAPHLEYASSRQLREMLVLRARMRLPWNKAKKTHPTNGHGTWLPVYWTWSRVDGDPLQQLGKRRWMKELDHPYRRGVGYGIPLGNVMLEVGVCRRKNLEPDPDQYGDYDDPGAVDALQARPLDDDIAAISTQYRGVANVASAEDS